MSIGLFDRFHSHPQSADSYGRMDSSSTSTATASTRPTTPDDGLHAECKALCMNLAGVSRYTDNSNRLDDIRRLVSFLPQVDSHKRTVAQTSKEMGKSVAKSLVREAQNSVRRGPFGVFLALPVHQPQLSAPSVPVNHALLGKRFYQEKVKVSSMPYVASAHKRAFDELMWQLKPRYNSPRRLMLKNADPIHHYNVYWNSRSTGNLEPRPEEIRRRVALAPAWADLIAQSSCLKPERRQLMVEMFAANLLDTSVDDRPVLTRAYGDSFSALAAALPLMSDPAHPDTLSQAQGTAISLLKEYTTGWYLEPEQQVAVAQALERVMTGLDPQQDMMLMGEIAHMRNSMTAQ